MSKPLFSKDQYRFILYFVGVFLVTAGILAAFGLLPSELQESSDGNTLTQEVSQSALGILHATDPNATKIAQNGQVISSENGNRSGTGASTTNGANGKIVYAGYPSRLIIPSIDLDTKVIIPSDTNVYTLDEGLTQGPVYYPGSGTPASGNMFIFGHSTGYKIVINKAYKVFNDIHTLTQGDEIDVVSNGNTFIYKVKSVSKVNKDETLVKFDTTVHLLTLSTCNSFGAKTDRYVVVAEYVGVK